MADEVDVDTSKECIQIALQVARKLAEARQQLTRMKTEEAAERPPTTDPSHTNTTMTDRMVILSLAPFFDMPISVG